MSDTATTQIECTRCYDTRYDASGQPCTCRVTVNPIRQLTEFFKSLR